MAPIRCFAIPVTSKFHAAWKLAICLSALFAGRHVQAAPPDSDPLKDPHIWLDMASNDATQAANNRPGELIGLLVYVGGAQVNAGDSAGALLTASQLLTRSARERLPEAGVVDRLAAASLFTSAGSPKQARVVLDNLEKFLLEKMGPPGTDHSPLEEEINFRWAIGGLAVQEARTGDVDHATALIMKLEKPGDRAEDLCDLADVLFDLKKPAEAKKTLDTAFHEAKKGDGTGVDWVHRETCSMLLGADEFDAAYHFAKVNDPYESPIYWLTQGLDWRFERGPRDSARAMAQRACAHMVKMPAENFRSMWDLLPLAEAQAFRAADPQGAVGTLQRGKALFAAATEDQRKSLLFKTAAIYARAGDEKSYQRDFAEAEKLHKKPGDAFMARLEYGGIAIALAQADKFDEAVAMAVRSKRDGAFIGVASQLARGGLLDRAMKSLNASESSSSDDLRDVIAAYIPRADLGEFRQYVKSIDDPTTRGFVELAAAEGLMNKRDSVRYIKLPPTRMDSQIIIGVGVGAGAGAGSATPTKK